MSVKERTFKILYSFRFDLFLPLSFPALYGPFLALTTLSSPLVDRQTELEFIWVLQRGADIHAHMRTSYSIIILSATLNTNNKHFRDAQTAQWLLYLLRILDFKEWHSNTKYIATIKISVAVEQNKGLWTELIWFFSVSDPDQDPPGSTSFGRIRMNLRKRWFGSG